MEITLFIRGQKLEAHYPPLYSGSVGVLYARFAEVDFDKTLVKAVRFKTADSDWYTADIADGAVRVPHEVIVSGGFDIALAGYENEDGKLARFLPTNSVHINVEENGYGDPDAPIESEGEPASYTAKIEKLTSDAAAKADAAMAELEKKANASEVYDKDTADALLGGKVDKVSGKGLSANDYTDEEKAKLGGLPTDSGLASKLAAKADLSFVKKLIPKATVLGDTLEIADHLGDMEAVNYRIYGNSTQASRSGKNLFNNGVLSAVRQNYPIYIENADNTLIASANGSGTVRMGAWIISTDEKNTFTISADSIAFEGNPTVLIRESNSFPEYITTISTFGSAVDTIVAQENFVKTIDVSSKYIAIVAQVVNDERVIFDHLQIEEGASPTAYEAYGVSPSEEFPSEIKSVGDVTEDLKYDIPIEVKDENGALLKRIHIYLDEPLRKTAQTADYLDFAAGQVVRRVEVLDGSGKLPIAQSFGVRAEPLVEKIVPDAVILPEKNKLQIAAGTTVSADIELTYYRDIGKKLAELSA